MRHKSGSEENARAEEDGGYGRKLGRGEEFTAFTCLV